MCADEFYSEVGIAAGYRIQQVFVFIIEIALVMMDH